MNHSATADHRLILRLDAPDTAYLRALCLVTDGLPGLALTAQPQEAELAMILAIAAVMLAAVEVEKWVNRSL